VHTIQLSRLQWLILDDHVRPRYLITEGPMVRRDTGETHTAWRVDWWAVEKSGRHTVAVVGGLLAAEAWCRYEIDQDTRTRAEVSRQVDITRQAPSR
jgi:hypothetical protein